MASVTTRETSMSDGRLSDWRYSMLAILGLNLSVPLVIGGLIAVAESGDLRVLICGAGVIAAFAGMALLRRLLQAYGSRAKACVPNL